MSRRFTVIFDHDLGTDDRVSLRIRLYMLHD